MQRNPTYRRWRVMLRVVAVLVVTFAAMVPVFALWLCRWQRPRARAAQCYFKVARRVLGIRIRTEGRPSPLRPLMIVANHASYLDVFVIGSQLPISFTPKREVRSWPLVGFLCVLADCIFVERKPGQMEEARDAMGKRIREGRVLCLFPEGTTSDGKNIKPFKSGFLSLAEDFALPVQPASLAYTHIGTTPITDAQRDQVAWVGDATFFGHFLHVLGLPSMTLTLRWHAPLQLSDFDDRKALTKEAQRIITAAVLTDLGETN